MRRGCLALALAVMGVLAHADARAQRLETQAQRERAVLDAGRRQAADPERQRLYREIRRANDAQLQRERQQRGQARQKKTMASPTPMPAGQPR